MNMKFKGWIGFGWMAVTVAGLQAQSKTAFTTPVGYSGGEVIGNKETFTTPVGMNTVTLEQGSNLFGITLHNSTLIMGELGEIGTENLSLVIANEKIRASGELPIIRGCTYILEITSGAKIGAIQEIKEWNGLRLKTPENLKAAGVATGDRFSLRRAATLDEVLDPRTTPLQAAKGPEDISEADMVLIPQAGGFLDLKPHFLLAMPGDAACWIDAITFEPAGSTPLIYADGLVIQRKSFDPVQIQCAGEMKTGPTSYVVREGLNLLATPSPQGCSLQELGLENDLNKGDVPNEADLVWIPKRFGGGEHVQYFIEKSGKWISMETFEAVTTPIPVGSAVMIERRGKPALFTLGDKAP